MTTDEAFNELLVKLFKDITEIEGRELVTEEFHDITYNDFHIIEGIGTKEAKTMTGIAKSMNVTTGTMTKAIEGLTEKGYVTRERSKEDKRIVFISLTEKGKRAYEHHEAFHNRMISSMKNSLSREELTVLAHSMEMLTNFFHEVYEENKKK